MKAILYIVVSITICINGLLLHLAKAESDFQQHLYEAQCLIQCYQNCNASLPKFEERSHLVNGSRCDGNTTCELNDLTLRHCNMKKEDQNPQIPISAASPSPIYHCTSRDQPSTQVYFRWEYSNSYVTTRKYLSELPPNLIPRVFIIQLKTNNMEWEFHSIQTDWLVPFNLTPGNTYSIRITPISPEAVYLPQTSEPIRIYNTSELKPTVPKSITMERIVNGEPTRVSGHTRNFLFRFESGAGTNASCSNEYALRELSPGYIKRSTSPERAFYFRFSNFLEFGSNQTVFVREALTTNFDESVEHKQPRIHTKPIKPLSKKIEYAVQTFQIPSCYEFHNYSFEECDPPQVPGFKVHKMPEGSFQLEWALPQYLSETNEIQAYTTWACDQNATESITSVDTCVTCWISSIWKTSSGEISTGTGFARNVSLIDNDNGDLLFCLTAISKNGRISPISNVTYYGTHEQQKPPVQPANATISSAWHVISEYSRTVFLSLLVVSSSVYFA